jgi:hypothetical protein
MLIGDILRDVRRKDGLGARGAHREVFDAWRKAAGIKLRKRAVPVRFQGGELVVEVASAVHRTELSGFTGQSILQKANAILGAKRITRVVYRVKS